MLTLKCAEKFENEENQLPNSWISWVWDWFKSFFVGPVPTLEDCFSAFFSSDELKGKNMYSCEKCKKLRNGVKRCSLFELPEVLCVHLKRFRLFEYGGGIGFSGKVSQYVQFPLDGLDLKRFLHSDCPNKVTNYRLLGTIVHMGSFTGGHYVAYIRRGDQWYVCDDSRVTPVTPETVAESEAYVLFYQKWDEDEDLTKQKMLQEWSRTDRDPEKDEKYHLLSRKWLTTFCWGEESGPIDNSDVVCPHGYFAPSDTVHLAGTWVPHSVWEIIQKRFGGGPDLLYQSECAICTAAWKRHQKQMQKSKSTPEPSFSLSGNTATISSNHVSFSNANNVNSHSPLLATSD
jgi:ubiquitin carboxyl-terminal hydrolase 20/33